jgi:hypothetical protein
VTGNGPAVVPWTVFTTKAKSRFSYRFRQVLTRHLADRWATGTVPPSRQSAARANPVHRPPPADQPAHKGRTT